MQDTRSIIHDKPAIFKLFLKKVSFFRADQSAATCAAALLYYDIEKDQSFQTISSSTKPFFFFRAITILAMNPLANTRKETAQPATTCAHIG